MTRPVVLAGRVAIAWIVLVLAGVAVDVVLPPRNGLLDVLATFEQILFLTALVAAPFALLSRARVNYAVALVLVATALVRYGPQWVSLPPSGQANLSVTAWNVEYGADAARRVGAGLADVNTDLVGLEEFQPQMQVGLLADPALSARYPYRVFDPDRGSLGAALLSRYPILEQEASIYPTYIRAVIEPPALGRQLVVYVVHPQSPEHLMSLAFNTDQRTADQVAIRALISADLAAGRTTLVLGDLNTTERDAAYSDFTVGLLDAHLDAGTGPGLTWRPDPLKFLPFGIFRIDYVLSSPDLAALTASVKCTDLSDHCQLQATLR